MSLIRIKINQLNVVHKSQYNRVDINEALDKKINKK